MHKPDLFSCLMMALVGVLWGVHSILIKVGFAMGMTFPQIAVGEYVVGALAFGAVSLWEKTRWPREDRRFWATMIVGGVAGSGVALFLFWSYQLGPVAIGATLLFLYVPFTQIINFTITRRPPLVSEMVSMVMVLAGAVIVADFLGVASATTLRGAPQAILAALSFALFFVFSSRLAGQSTPIFRSFFFAVTSGTLVLVIVGLCNWKLLTPAMLEPKAILWLIVMGVCGQVIPIFLMVCYGPKTGSGLGSILTAAELPVAIVLSVLVLGDSITSLQVAGVILVLSGIVVPNLPGGKWTGLRRIGREQADGRETR